LQEARHAIVTVAVSGFKIRFGQCLACASALQHGRQTAI